MTTRLNLIGSNLETAPQQSAPFEPQEESLWMQEDINLPSTYFTEEFQFRFVFTSEGNNRLFIDDVNVDVNASVTDPSFTFRITVQPNPTQESVHVSFNLDQPQQIQLQLIDLTGKKVYEEPSVKLSAGAHGIDLNVSDLSKGVYLIRLSSDQASELKRLIVN